MVLVFTDIYENKGIYSVLVIIILYLARHRILDMMPQALKGWIDLREKKQEHKQKTEAEEFAFEKMKELAKMYSLSFIEEQLTQMTAETQTQLNESNTFIRSEVDAKLDMILEKISGLKSVIYEIKEIQQFTLMEVREDDDTESADTELA